MEVLQTIDEVIEVLQEGVSAQPHLIRQIDLLVDKNYTQEMKEESQKVFLKFKQMELLLSRLKRARAMLGTLDVLRAIEYPDEVETFG